MLGENSQRESEGWFLVESISSDGGRVKVLVRLVFSSKGLWKIGCGMCFDVQTQKNSSDIAYLFVLCQNWNTVLNKDWSRIIGRNNWPNKYFHILRKNTHKQIMWHVDGSVSNVFTQKIFSLYNYMNAVRFNVTRICIFIFYGSPSHFCSALNFKLCTSGAMITTGTCLQHYSTGQYTHKAVRRHQRASHEIWQPNVLELKGA